MCAIKICGDNGAMSFGTRRVPNEQFHFLALDIDLLNREVDDGDESLLVGSELALSVFP
jgi:hypothetical protein